KDGKPAACIPNPEGACVHPYYDPGAIDQGGPHHVKDAVTDMNGGKMNGFIRAAFANQQANCARNKQFCMPGTSIPDVMGYKMPRQIPNYWTYAKDFVLNDHMFSSTTSWSLPAHLYMVSAWSARCLTAGKPLTCISQNKWPAACCDGVPKTSFAWTDI